MDFKLKYADCIDWYGNMQSQLMDWTDKLSILTAMMQEIAYGNAISGSAADKFISYIKEVHLGQIIPGIVQIQLDMAAFFLNYIAGLEKMEQSVDAVEDSLYLEELERELENRREGIVNILDGVKMCADSIAHIMDVYPRSTENMDCAYESLKKQVSRTRKMYEEFEEEQYEAAQKYMGIMCVTDYTIREEMNERFNPLLYTSSNHSVDVLNYLEYMKNEYFPYTDVFDGSKYKENVGLIHEIQTIRTYDKIGNQAERKRYAAVVYFGKAIFCAYKKDFRGFSGSIVGMMDAHEEYENYKDIDEIAEKWKEDGTSIYVEGLSPYTENPYIGSIEDMYSCMSDVQAIVDFCVGGENLNSPDLLNRDVVDFTQSIMDLKSIIKDEDGKYENMVIDSIRYDNYITQLYDLDQVIK